MTKVFFVRHAEPNYDNHDDRSRELSPRGMEDRKKVTSFLADKNIVVGSHGTSLSTIINFYDNSFGYDDFERIRFLMPWIVEFSFDELGNCVDIKRHSV